jgi:hypothetical protein
MWDGCSHEPTSYDFCGSRLARPSGRPILAWRRAIDLNSAKRQNKEAYEDLDSEQRDWIWKAASDGRLAPVP